MALLIDDVVIERASGMKMKVIRVLANGYYEMELEEEEVPHPSLLEQGYTPAPAGTVVQVSPNAEFQISISL